MEDQKLREIEHLNYFFVEVGLSAETANSAAEKLVRQFKISSSDMVKFVHSKGDLNQMLCDAGMQKYEVEFLDHFLSKNSATDKNKKESIPSEKEGRKEVSQANSSRFRWTNLVGSKFLTATA